MDKHKKNPESTPELSRRSLLTGALIGAGTLLGMVGVYQVTEVFRQPQAPEFESTPSWSQDFLSTTAVAPDRRVWRYDTDPKTPSYNQEYQGYTTDPRNVRIEPGVGLVIEAHRESYVYPRDKKELIYDYTSGKIDTLDSFNFEYGKVEATIKMPRGAGAWPAFWLLSANEVNTIDSNTSHDEQDDPRFYMKNGEIDIMEFYGQRPDQFETTVHTFDDTFSNTVEVPGISDEFHTYGLELSPDLITWTLDDKPRYTFQRPSDSTDAWPFSHGNRMYIILNLAMGGTGGETVDQQYESWRMEVQDVRFYDLKHIQ